MKKHSISLCMDLCTHKNTMPRRQYVDSDGLLPVRCSGCDAVTHPDKVNVDGLCTRCARHFESVRALEGFELNEWLEESCYGSSGHPLRDDQSRIAARCIPAMPW